MFKRSLVASAVFATSLLPSVSHADGPEDPSASGIEEVMVTARRRSEAAQDVPLPISTLQGERLEDTGTFNVNRLQQLQPSLQFFSSNPRNTAVNIRGIGAPFGLTNDGIEQGVGFYVDEVYYSRIAASTFDFLDVEQIEVLRGPQGTLYGKNTTAGAMNITTRKPTFDREGRAELSFGNLGHLQAKGALSGAIVDDKLAFRLVSSVTRRDGFFKNTENSAEVNEADNLGVRGQLLYLVNEDVELTLAADYNRQNPECCGQVYVDDVPTLRALNRQYASLAAQSNYSAPSEDAFDRKLSADTELNARQEFGGISLHADWDLGWGDFTSVTAWRTWDWGPSNDRDYTGLPITTVSANPSEQEQWTQEFRIASTGDNTIDYVVGVFGFHQTIDSTGLQEQGSAATLWLLGPTQAAATPDLLTGLRQETDIAFENDSVALFGQLTWNITDTLRLQPGLRLNYDKKTADYDAVASGGLETSDPNLIRAKAGVLQSQAYEADFDDTNVSGDINLSWDATENVMLYGLYARSFKSGGVNLSGIPNRLDGTPATELAEVDPEEIDHYEVGVKSRWLEDRLTVNASLFRSDIADYQATVVSNAVGTLRGYLANAEEVRSQGAELEVTFAPLENLSVYASGTWNDAEYVSFESAPPPLELSGGAVQFVDISGEDLPGVSEWAASFGGEYSLGATLFDANGEYYTALDGSYRSEWSSNPSPSRYMWVDAYTLLNLRAGFRADEGWGVSLWARNLTDAEYYDFLTAQPGSTGMIAGQPGDPRTYGATYTLQF
jgi:iron complex outermembrane receptor protein